MDPDLRSSLASLLTSFLAPGSSAPWCVSEAFFACFFFDSRACSRRIFSALIKYWPRPAASATSSMYTLGEPSVIGPLPPQCLVLSFMRANGLPFT